MTRRQALLFVSAAALLIGATLPWVSWVGLFGEAGRAGERLAVGWEGDGTITAACGLVLLAGIWWARERPPTVWTVAAILAALVALAVAVADFARIAEIGPAAGVLRTARVGLYLTLIGALTGLMGSLMGLAMQQREHGETPVRTT